MYLYFNKNGQLLERLEHGPQARAGSTNFEIFAYFEGLNVDTLYTDATLTLIKPDFDRSIEGNLYMPFVNDVKYEIADGENPTHFVNGKTYKGFYFSYKKVQHMSN